MLTPDQKLNRLEISKAHFGRFKSDPANFPKNSGVVQDETWVHHCDPESKIRSKQSKHAASVVSDCEGVLMIDYLQKGTNY